VSKYNHNANARKDRVWRKNVGDGAKLSSENRNPNDAAR
jgi:hypothetical protein